MGEYIKIALGNPIIMGVILVILVVIIGIIVKATKTQKDDAIYAMIVNAFNIAEKVIPDGTGPTWLKKTDTALKTFNDEFKKREGKAPTEDILQFAKDQWAILANELKKPAA